MSRFSRFLPKFLRTGNKDASKQTGDKSQCKIIFLDETEYYMPYKGGLKGQYVLDRAFEQLNLFEKDYFGVRYIDNTGQTHWLDIAKALSSQMKGCNIPYTFYFGVKFYPADPCKLKEEITRYQFFLQVKCDILHGRLPVSFEEAAELFAYAVQSELGDFESQHLPTGYVSEFQFVPNQTEEFEGQIEHLHRRLGGTVPATAELKFLDKVKWLDMYGVDLHPVMGEGNTEYFLGLTPTGIVVYKNKTKVGNYFWPRITKVNQKGKVFVIRVKDKINDEHTYAFEVATKPGCKHLWKCCVEHHAFFRLNQLGSTPRSSKPFRSTAKHRNSGRQDRQSSMEQSGREQPRVLRVQSRRQARRAMSDPRLHQGDMASGIQYTEGHVTMMVKPEHVRGSRHRSLPDLKDRESPTSTRSAPWETNMDVGLYTSGRESPVSYTQSENVKHSRRNRDSDSEAGYRRKYFPSSRKGSDNESDVSFTRRRRREMDSGSESDVSPKMTARQRKAKSMGADNFDNEFQSAMKSMHMPDKENRPNGSIPSLHSAPLGESRQKKQRRRRSKSPGTSKRPPEELRSYIEYGMLEPTEDFTEDQLKEIPYMNVETKAEPFKVKYSPSNRRRYRSPKRKSVGDLDPGVKNGYVSEETAPPPAYTRTPERTPEPKHRQMTTGGYYSDTGSLSRRGRTLPTTYSQQQQYNNSPVFSHKKPIDQTDDRGSTLTDHSQNNNSTHSSEPRQNVLVSDQMDDLQQGHMEIGQGHDISEGQLQLNLDFDDRNHEPGLNSSHSSGSANAPHMVRGAPGYKYGTQDAIARLYSSPAGTPRQQHRDNTPSSGSANRNTSYSGARSTNQGKINRNQSMNSTNQNSAFNKSGAGLIANQNVSNVSTNHHSPYNRTGTQANQVNSRSHTTNSGPPPNYSDIADGMQSTNYRSQGVNSQTSDSQYNYMMSPDYNRTQVGPSRGPNLQNGYANHTKQNYTQSPASSNNKYYPQNDTRQSNTRHSGVNVQQTYMQSSSGYNDGGGQSRGGAYSENDRNKLATPPSRQVPVPSHQNTNSPYIPSKNHRTVNQNQSDRLGYQSDSYGNQSSRHGNQSGSYGNQSNRHGNQSDNYGTKSNRSDNHSGSYGNQSNRHGNQSDGYGIQSNRGGHQTDVIGNPAPRQYGSMGRSRSATRPGTMGNVQQDGNTSQDGRSPASSPVRRTRQQQQSGTNVSSANQKTSSSHMPVSTANQKTSSSHMTSVTPPSYRSPDSAISSLTSLSISNRSSPRKQAKPDIEQQPAFSNNNNNPNKSTIQSDPMKEGYSRTKAPTFGRSDIWTEL